MLKTLYVSFFIWIWLSIFFQPIVKYLNIDYWTYLSCMYGISCIIGVVVVVLSEIGENINKLTK